MGDTDETVYTAEYLAMAAATLAEDRAKLVAAVLDATAVLEAALEALKESGFQHDINKAAVAAATAVLEAAVIAMDEWDLD